MLQCITNSDRENGYNSSLQLPDATLNFAKKHPLMEDKALARPLLLTKGVNFTKLVVDRVSALDQRAYNMLFIGTGTHSRLMLELRNEQRTHAVPGHSQCQGLRTVPKRSFVPPVFPALWARGCRLLFAEAVRAQR